MRYIMLALLVVASAALALTGLALNTASRESRRTDVHICVAVNNLDRAITQSLQRRLTNLPKIDYYKHHPRELNHQLAEIRRELHVFKQRDCSHP